MENLRIEMEGASPGHKENGRVIKILANPDSHLFYDAPVLVLVFTAPNAITPDEDGSLAAENMMRAAHPMGIDSCWIWFAAPLGQNPEVMDELGVLKDHKLIVPLIFGYP